jgi:N-acetylglucosamine-6-phosphate deacetylase
LLSQNILPSAGHSMISAKDFETEYQLGIRHVTHLFNAMSGFDQHRPGLAVGAFNHDDLVAEVISDGVHIKPELLKTIYDHKGPDGIAIITDAMNAKGLVDGAYKLGPLKVEKKGMEVRLVDNHSLAGAAATYDYNVRMFQKINQFGMQELIKMTSINVAKQLKIFEQTGSIAVNKLADLVVLNPNLEVMMTISEGELAFEK